MLVFLCTTDELLNQRLTQSSHSRPKGLGRDGFQENTAKDATQPADGIVLIRSAAARTSFSPVANVTHLLVKKQHLLTACHVSIGWSSGQYS